MSETPELHRARVVARFAPSTLAAYLRSWQTWVDFSDCHHASPYQPAMALVADFLQVSSHASSLGVATAQSRALTWVAKARWLFCVETSFGSTVGTILYMIPSEMVLRRLHHLP